MTCYSKVSKFRGGLNIRIFHQIRKHITALTLAAVSSVSAVSAASVIPVSAKKNTIAIKAISRVGSSYRTGAGHSRRSVRNSHQHSFDCSGLVNWSCYQSGHKIGLRTSSSLRSVGHGVSKRKMKSGDILLFPHHAGIYVGKGKMVHAPGHGRRVSLVRLGRYWMRRCRSVRRV